MGIPKAAKTGKILPLLPMLSEEEYINQNANVKTKRKIIFLPIVLLRLHGLKIPEKGRKAKTKQIKEVESFS